MHMQPERPGFQRGDMQSRPGGADFGQDAAREANLAELQEKLNAALQKLSEPHRLVVVLHDVQGLSHEEIAKEWMQYRHGEIAVILRTTAITGLVVRRLKPT